MPLIVCYSKEVIKIPREDGIEVLLDAHAQWVTQADDECIQLHVRTPEAQLV